MDSGYTPLAVIGAMALATLLTRWSGFWIMDHVPLTPRLRAGLQALPGAIMISTIVPLMIRGGPAAIAGVVVAVALMAVTRKDMLALASGLGVIAGLRAFGWG